jgi:hypothetical protein
MRVDSGDLVISSRAGNESRQPQRQGVERRIEPGG